MTTPTDEPAFQRLVLLAERLASGRTADERDLAELEGLPPGSMMEPPEAALAAAGLYGRLGPRLGRWRPPALAAVRLGADPRQAETAVLHNAFAGRRSTAPPNPPGLDWAGTGDPEQIRRVLTRLAEEHRGPEPDKDPRLRLLIDELLKHPGPKVRLHAHRSSRAMLGRTAYLRHTAVLLDDPQPDVTRTAIRTLCHAGWEPAIPGVVGMLTHAHPVVRTAAREGLTRMGMSAVPAPRHAAGHARPHKRPLYEAVLNQIVTSADDA